MRKKVLFVEDQARFHDSWKAALNGPVDIFTAVSILEAEEALTTHPDIAVIVMDAQLPEYTGSLVVRIRMQRNFSGHMIAASGNELLRRALVRAGCNHECEKDHVPNKVREILELQA